MNEENEEELFYTILDEDGFIEAVAVSVASCFDSENTKEVYDYVNKDQMLNFVRERCLGYDEGNMVISAKVYEDSVNDIAQAMQGKMLAKLAAEGFLESAWDDELNDMVFWLADETHSNKKQITKAEAIEKGFIEEDFSEEEFRKQEAEFKRMEAEMDALWNTKKRKDNEDA